MSENELQIHIYGFIEDVPEGSIKAARIELAEKAIRNSRPDLLEQLKTSIQAQNEAIQAHIVNPIIEEQSQRN